MPHCCCCFAVGCRHTDAHDILELLVVVLLTVGATTVVLGGSMLPFC